MDRHPFIVLTLLSARTDGSDTKPLYQENIVLVKAHSGEEASEIAEQNARRDAITYLNAGGQTVAWTFEKIVDVCRILDSDLSGDCVDLYSRHFRDRDAYDTFDRSIAETP